MAAAVIAAVVATASSAAAAAAAGAVITAGSLLATFGVSLALGIVARALAPSAPSSGVSNNIEQRGITRQVRQPITNRKIVYGEDRVSGAIVRFESTNNEEFLHMVIVLAGHEVEEIGEVWIDDYPIVEDMIDGSTRIVNTGRYDGLIRIVKEKGDQTVANAMLVSDTSATSTDVGNETAYLYVRLKYDRDKFPNGIPNISAWVKGKKCYDPRDTTTRYTPNIALMCRDHLADVKYGLGAKDNELDDTYTNSAANKCDEIQATTVKSFTPSAVDNTSDLVSIDDDLLYLQTGDQVEFIGTPPAPLTTGVNYYVIPYQRKKSDDTKARFGFATTLANAVAGTLIDITGTSTAFTIRKNGEPRYYGGGVLESSTEPKANIEDIISGMAGRAVYSGGTWKLRAGAYVAPNITLDENHLIGGVSVQTKVRRTERFNTVKGTYISQINNGQPTDYPSVTNATYVTQDNGEEMLRDLPLAFTQRPHTAQRIAKIELEKMRQEIAFTASFKLHAMQLIVGDTVQITLDKFGWTDKIFEVTEWGLNVSKSEDGIVPIVNMSLRETATTVYDWNSGEEEAVDPAPNTNFPNPFDVAAPTGLTATPVEVPTAGGDLTYKFILSWTPPANTFVTNGGHYDVQFKQTGETDWGTSFPAKDDDIFIDVNQVRPGVNYDARIRSVNNLGVRSSWNSLFGFTIESPSGANIVLDYLLVTQAVTDMLDYGNITDSVDGINDFGSIT